ncbi:Bbp16 family capsid cement protein [Phaeospirillum tilakii]|uniref:Bbp16 family capsid cement protein n=1 Tax=Phaeospirillum tilakii TaxID=741673 RepID=A0ABW5C780_9PROT
MILDERTEFCDATTLNTGAAGTYLLGDVIDLGKTGLDMGQGNDLYLVIQVDTAATSGGSATATFKLASDAQPAIATDGSASVHIVTDTIAVASLTAGKTVYAGVLPRGTYERYLGLLQVTGTAAFTAGKVNAFLTHDPAGWKAYADAS